MGCGKVMDSNTLKEGPFAYLAQQPFSVLLEIAHAVTTLPEAEPQFLGRTVRRTVVELKRLQNENKRLSQELEAEIAARRHTQKQLDIVVADRNELNRKIEQARAALAVVDPRIQPVDIEA